MDALLINVPIDGNQDLSEPLGIQYVGAYSRSKGFEVDVVDTVINRFTVAQTIDYIKGRDYRVIGISVPFQNYLSRATEIIELLRDSGVDSHITVGGTAVSLAYREMLTATPGLDSVVIGDGEHTFYILLESIKKGTDWKDTRGIAYLENGSIVFKRGRLIEDLDSLPFPRFFDYRKSPYNQYNVSISASRGCYASCSFCSIHSLSKLSEGQKWRCRSPENIADELELLSQQGVKRVIIRDDNFLGFGASGKARALSVADTLSRRSIDMKYLIEARATEMKEDILRPLMDVGLQGVFVGIESINQCELDYFNKGIKVEDNLKAIETLERLGLYCDVGYILFSPITSRDNLINSLKFLKDLPTLNPYHLGRLYICYGTPAYESIRRDGLGIGDGLGYNYYFMNQCVGQAWEFVEAVRQPFLNTRARLIGLCMQANICFNQPERSRYQGFRGETMALRSRYIQLFRQVIDGIMESLDNSREDSECYAATILAELDSIEQTADRLSEQRALKAG